MSFTSSTTSLGSYAVADCGGSGWIGYGFLTSITIPTSVTRIGYGAIGWNAQLKSVNIPSSVTYIGDVAFFLCLSLTSITIPTSVSYIGMQPVLFLKYITLS